MRKRRNPGRPGEDPDLAQEGACRGTPEPKVIGSRWAPCAITEARGQVAAITKEPGGHQVREEGISPCLPHAFPNLSRSRMNIFSCSFIFSASPHTAAAAASSQGPREWVADTRKRPSELGKGLWLPPLGQRRLQTGLAQLC